MRRSPLAWITAAGLFAGLVVGGWFLARWLFPPPTSVAGPPQLNPPQHRQAIAVPKVPFTNITDKAGIHFTHCNGATPLKLLPETMGAGVAFLDYDGDGRQDILFVNSCPWPGHDGPKTHPVLYRNKGDGTFEDVTDKAGLNTTFYGLGVAVGDFDNDGYPDLFLTGIGGNHLFHNEKGKTFTEVTAAAGVAAPVSLPKVSRAEFDAWEAPIPFGSSCTFLDYDGDGRLDLFVCHYVKWSPKIDLGINSTLGGMGRSYSQPTDFEGSQCVLYRNIDGQHFQDVSASAGIQVTEPEGTNPGARLRPVGKSLGVVICDPDEDGWPDIVVANDTVRNFFFHNIPGPDGTRRFEERGYPSGVAYADEGRPRGGMGIDWGEYRPGRQALIIGNFANEPNTFLTLDQPKKLLFSDSALAVGVSGPSRILLKFGAFFFDYDLDGRLDLLTANGHIEPEIATIQNSQTYAQPLQLFWNTGNPERLFEPVTAEEGGKALAEPMVGRSCAFADIDGDGDLDVVVTANGGPARLLRNDQNLGNHWIRLELKGDGVHSNRSAIGAQVTIEAGGKTFKRQITGARGYLSQSELPLTVGLGKLDKVDRVTVRWPGREAGTEVWENLPLDQMHPLLQGKGKKN